MPNWCYNRVEIEGPKDVMDDFKKTLMEANEKNKLFANTEGGPHRAEFGASPGAVMAWNEAFVPLAGEDPRRVPDLRCGSWGTKWEVDCPEWEEGDKYFSIQFQTAWNPNLPVSKAIHDRWGAQGLAVTHYYDESGEVFAGVASYAARKIHENPRHQHITGNDTGMGEYFKMKMDVYGADCLEDINLRALTVDGGTQPGINDVKTGDLLVNGSSVALIVRDSDTEARLLFQDEAQHEIDLFAFDDVLVSWDYELEDVGFDESSLPYN